MNANIEIVFRDFLKINFLDLRGLWFGRRYNLIDYLFALLFVQYAIYSF